MCTHPPSLVSHNAFLYNRLNIQDTDEFQGKKLDIKKIRCGEGYILHLLRYPSYIPLLYVNVHAKARIARVYDKKC
jgi:hypothetical protein